jgi:RHS repeat-associated protein
VGIFDVESGLCYYRARYYDPSVGRFVSEDPLGFEGGQDFYSYVFNRPIDWADPAGFIAQDINKIKDQCKKCTQELTNQGLRYDAQWKAGRILERLFLKLQMV